MRKGIWQEFDGYDRVASEIEASRKFPVDYAVEKDSVEQVIGRLHPKKLRLRVADVIEETVSAKTLRLVSKEGYLPPFLAGQYLSLILNIGQVRTNRPYSISSPPNQTGYYDITVRRVEGGLVSNYLLDQVKRGQELESSGPAGHFYFNPLFHDRTMVCLAGGSGITPFMSMIREVLERGLDRTIFLFYGNRTLEEAIFHDLLLGLADRFDNFHYRPVIEHPPAGYRGATGFISAQVIQAALGHVFDKTFYLCGPQAMYDFCLPELARLEVPGRKIRREVYGAPLNIHLHPGWPEEVKPEAAFTVRVKNGPEFKARAGESLLAALEKNGLTAPSLCRSGECSLCRIKVLSGQVFQPAGALVRKSDRKYGYVHACVSYPLADLALAL
ncbi:MAG: FAD-binding oxidoreductase [Thermodesulfobacteriota bacterium]